MRKIILMADYHCHPLWEASSVEYNISPSSLPISKSLADRLDNWADSYTRTLNDENPLESGFQNSADELNFKVVGEELGQNLRDELGSDFEVEIRV